MQRLGPILVVAVFLACTCNAIESGEAQQHASPTSAVSLVSLRQRARALVDTQPAEAVRLLQQRAGRADCPATTAEDAELLGDSLSAGGRLSEAATQFRMAIDLAETIARKRRRKNSKIRNSMAVVTRAVEAAEDQLTKLRSKLAWALVQIQTPASIE